MYDLRTLAALNARAEDKERAKSQQNDGYAFGFEDGYDAGHAEATAAAPSSRDAVTAYRLGYDHETTSPGQGIYYSGRYAAQFLEGVKDARRDRREKFLRALRLRLQHEGFLSMELDSTIRPEADAESARLIRTAARIELLSTHGYVR